ncbi:MAG: MarR family transcriptional regulator [Promethearchaeota archaeon]
MREYQGSLLKFYLDLGKAKNADLKLQTLLGYLSIHKILTQKQFKDLTGYSTGSISKKLNFLIKSGVIKKKAIAKSNEKMYQIDENIYEKVGDLSYTEFPKIKNFLENKLGELQEHDGEKGKEALSNRIVEIIKVLDVLTNIWNDISVIFRKPTL